MQVRVEYQGNINKLPGKVRYINIYKYEKYNSIKGNPSKVKLQSNALEGIVLIRELPWKFDVLRAS